MQEIPPSALTPFVFSDPAGKRWPRLRLTLLIFGVLAFLGTVLFVQTLFVAPQMRVPFSLRQLKGQLKALQKQNPASPVAQASLLCQASGQEDRGRDANSRAAGETAQEGAAERSPARLLHERRSLQLHLARRARLADYPSLSGLDHGRERFGRHSDRPGQPAAKILREQRNRADAVADQFGWR